MSKIGFFALICYFFLHTHNTLEATSFLHSIEKVQKGSGEHQRFTWQHCPKKVIQHLQVVEYHCPGPNTAEYTPFPFVERKVMQILANTFYIIDAPSKEGCILYTKGLYDCVAVSIHFPEAGVSAMTHLDFNYDAVTLLKSMLDKIDSYAGYTDKKTAVVTVSTHYLSMNLVQTLKTLQEYHYAVSLLDYDLIAFEKACIYDESLQRPVNKYDFSLGNGIELTVEDDGHVSLSKAKSLLLAREVALDTHNGQISNVLFPVTAV